MKEHLATVLVTLLVFLAGLGTGVLTQKIRPLPPPPLPVMGEFRQAEPLALPQRPLARPEEVEQRLAALRPQIEAFRQKLASIEQACRTEIEAALTLEQKERWARERRSGPGEPGAEPVRGRVAAPANRPAGPERLGPMPGVDVVPIVIYKPMLEHLTKTLDLNADQQARVEQALRTRRDRVIELVDRTPPPSLGMGRIGRGEGGPDRGWSGPRRESGPGAVRSQPRADRETGSLPAPEVAPPPPPLEPTSEQP